MKSFATTVTTTPTLVVPADDINRTIYLHSGTGSVYIGGSNVTSSTGVHLTNGTTIQLFVPLKETVYAVTSASSQTLITMTPDNDN